MYSSVDGNLGSFHILAMGNNAAMNIGCMYLFDFVFLLSSDIYLRVELLDDIVGLPRWLSGKESACKLRRGRRLRFKPWVRKIPWKRKWPPSLVCLTGEFHGLRSLMGYSL